jgi:Fic family protein
MLQNHLKIRGLWCSLIGNKIGNMTRNKSSRSLFDHPSDMEPLLPEDGEGRLADTALLLIRKTERLRGRLHPITRKSVGQLVRSMNSFYSNLIEGHRTTPRDIDAALTKDFSADETQRALQLQHVAHVETQAEMETRLQTSPAAEVCSADFLCWLHERFYQRLPESLRRVSGPKGQWYDVLPGRLREVEVSIGRHLAPASEALAGFLKRFAEFYGPRVTPSPTGLVAAAAAHHRLAWIHPFLDGNGRVARLFTHAWFVKAAIDGEGLWTISRGLARRQADYRAALAKADEKRRNDFDGRGYLSQRFLGEFCEFFLRTAVDQAEFMGGLLDLDGLQARIIGYADRKEAAKELPRGAGAVLRETFLRGEIARGEVPRIMGASARTGQKLIGELLRRRLLISDSPKGRLRLEFPAEAAGHYFPNLYPAGG